MFVKVQSCMESGSLQVSASKYEAWCHTEQIIGFAGNEADSDLEQVNSSLSLSFLIYKVGQIAVGTIPGFPIIHHQNHLGHLLKI